jgi:predicted regulator of Ras-like GTPase activity (Roadblock/LC7/MglB family)
MATHRQSSAEAKPPRRRASGASVETTHGEHNAYEVEKVEPAGLPAFGANPITVPSLAAIPIAVVPPEVDPPEPDPLEVGTLAVDPLMGDPLADDSADLPEPEMRSAWPFAESATIAVPSLELNSDELPGDVSGSEPESADGGRAEVSLADFPVLEIFDRGASRSDLEDDPLGLGSGNAAAELTAVVAAAFEVPPEEPSTPHPAHGRNELGLDADIAAHWDLWSAQIGRALMPTLRELGRSMQGFSCAMICTADGFNLCTLGVDEAGVLRLAALTSSMHSMADAVTQAVHGDPERRLDLLTLTDQTSTIVVLAIRDLIIGKLLLWVATEEETLGALLVRSRLAAAQVRQLLHVDEP